MSVIRVKTVNTNSEFETIYSEFENINRIKCKLIILNYKLRILKHN